MNLRFKELSEKLNMITPHESDLAFQRIAFFCNSLLPDGAGRFIFATNQAESGEFISVKASVRNIHDPEGGLISFETRVRREDIHQKPHQLEKIIEHLAFMLLEKLGLASSIPDYANWKTIDIYGNRILDDVELLSDIEDNQAEIVRLLGQTMKKANFIPRKGKVHIRIIHQTALGKFYLCADPNIGEAVHTDYTLARSYCNRVNPGFYETAGEAAKVLFDC